MGEKKQEPVWVKYGDAKDGILALCCRNKLSAIQYGVLDNLIFRAETREIKGEKHRNIAKPVYESKLHLAKKLGVSKDQVVSAERIMRHKRIIDTEKMYRDGTCIGRYIALTKQSIDVVVQLVGNLKVEAVYSSPTIGAASSCGMGHSPYPMGSHPPPMGHSTKGLVSQPIPYGSQHQGLGVTAPRVVCHSTKGLVSEPIPYGSQHQGLCATAPTETNSSIHSSTKRENNSDDDSDTGSAPDSDTALRAKFDPQKWLAEKKMEIEGKQSSSTSSVSSLSNTDENSSLDGGSLEGPELVSKLVNDLNPTNIPPGDLKAAQGQVQSLWENAIKGGLKYFDYHLLNEILAKCLQLYTIEQHCRIKKYADQRWNIDARPGMIDREIKKYCTKHSMTCNADTYLVWFHKAYTNSEKQERL